MLENQLDLTEWVQRPDVKAAWKNMCRLVRNRSKRACLPLQPLSQEDLSRYAKHGEGRGSWIERASKIRGRHIYQCP